MKNRKFKYGGMSVTVTVLFIAGVVLFNVLFGLLSDRFYLKADLTQNKIYNISEDSVKILQELPESVTITVLANESDVMSAPYNIAHELISKYETLSNGNIKVEYLAPKLNPGLNERFPAATLHELDIIVQSSRRYISTNIDDMYTWDMDDSGSAYVATHVKVEQVLTGSILYAVQEQVPKAVFTTGHDETSALDLASLTTQLRLVPYELEEIDLKFQEFPETASLVIICGPQSDFTKEELDKMDRFLANGSGNKCLYLPYPGAESLTELELYLSEWGIAPQKAIVADSDAYVTERIQIVLDIDHTITESEFEGYTAKPIITLATPINRLFNEKGSRRTDVIMSSSGKSYSKSLEDGQLSSSEKSSGDPSGPFDIGILCTDIGFDDMNREVRTQVFAVGWSFVADEYLNTSSYLNGRLLSYLFNRFNTQRTDLIVEPIATIQEPLTLSGGQGNTIFWMLVVLMPVLVWAAGGIVWYRRRNL